MNLQIEFFKQEHYSEIAEIWVRQLPNDFFSLLGETFIKKKYLPFLLEHSECNGCVENSQGKVGGFVLWGPSDKLLSDFLKKNFFHFLVSMISFFIRSPIICTITCVDIIKFLLKCPPIPHGTELLYIAVDSPAQGLGAKLVERLVDETKHFSQPILVKTLLTTPRTIRFYEKCGFERLCSIQNRQWLIKKAPY